MPDLPEKKYKKGGIALFGRKYFLFIPFIREKRFAPTRKAASKLCFLSLSSFWQLAAAAAAFP